MVLPCPLIALDLIVHHWWSTVELRVSLSIRWLSVHDWIVYGVVQEFGIRKLISKRIHTLQSWMRVVNSSHCTHTWDNLLFGSTILNIFNAINVPRVFVMQSSSWGMETCTGTSVRLDYISLWLRFLPSQRCPVSIRNFGLLRLALKFIDCWSIEHSLSSHLCGFAHGSRIITLSKVFDLKIILRSSAHGRHVHLRISIHELLLHLHGLIEVLLLPLLLL